MRPNAWIRLLSYEGRVRHAGDRRREAMYAEWQASVRTRVVADLRRAITRDIEGFLNAASHAPAHGFTCCNGQSAQGFVVTRTDNRVVTRTLAVDLNAGTLSCSYTLGRRTGEPIDERRLAIEIAGDGAALSLWNHGINRTFATVDVLGAFLLAPMLDTA
jgi:hypothetical protein